MTTLFPIQLQCPVCNNIFDSNEIGSCGHASKRADFRPNYWGANPVEFFYHLCTCGFCSIKSLFKLEINNKDFIEKIENLGPLRHYTLAQKIERAMICLELLNEFGYVDLNNLDLANNWINAFWWARNSDEINKFGKKVLDYFQDAYENNLIKKDEILTIRYLMGEINRRMGNIESANKFYDEVISQSKDIKDQEDIYKLALRQKTDPKENL
ncbi:MAG: DUF2225 domain-containing protein [Promethearchaeota archaeon]|nr:MAG: DUF2225 domain-containing protein [Candidatus Lokiarchaeota archaeon]